MLLWYALIFAVDPTSPPLPTPIEVNNSGSFVLITAMTGLLTALGSLLFGYLNYRSRMRELEIEAEERREERQDRRRRNEGPPGRERRVTNYDE